MLKLSIEHASHDIRRFTVRRKDGLFTLWDYLLFFVILNLLLLLFVQQGYLQRRIEARFVPHLLLTLIFFSFMRYTWRILTVKEESLLVIKDLGIQKESLFYGGVVRSQFIEKDSILGIFLNEGIKHQQYIFYLCFVVKGKKKMVLPFNDLFLPFDQLLTIYKGINEMIFPTEFNKAED